MSFFLVYLKFKVGIGLGTQSKTKSQKSDGGITVVDDKQILKVQESSPPVTILRWRKMNRLVDASVSSLSIRLAWDVAHIPKSCSALSSFTWLTRDPYTWNTSDVIVFIVLICLRAPESREKINNKPAIDFYEHYVTSINEHDGIRPQYLYFILLTRN